MREVIGDENDVAVDFHGRTSIAAARQLGQLLAPVRPLFIEEPVLPEHLEQIGEVVASTTIPVACGERLYSRAEFLPALQQGVALVQPDISHAGGISEARRIASLADTFGALLAPHCPLGPLALAASLHVAFATPNFLIQEQSIGIHYNAGAENFDYMLDTTPFRFTGGHIERWEAPGLGVETDEKAVRRAADYEHQWRPPVWHHPDGSHAEW